MTDNLHQDNCDRATFTLVTFRFRKRNKLKKEVWKNKYKWKSQSWIVATGDGSTMNVDEISYALRKQGLVRNGAKIEVEILGISEIY